MKNNKKIMITCLIVIFFWNMTNTYANTNDINVSNFLTQIKEYQSDFIPELSQKNLLENITSGNWIKEKSLVERISQVFTSEIKSSIRIIFSVIGVSLICGILKNMQSSFGGTVSEVAFYVCYLFVVILIISTYTEIVEICQNTVNHLSSFMNLLIPLILTLMVANGSISTVGMLQPILLLMVSVINVIVSKIILPVLLISTMIGLISHVSENIDISKLPKFLQKTCMWGLELMIVIFVGVLSLEGTLASNVDGITVKGTKTVVSTIIPVVGKAISDATDSILGAASITKNAIGVLGVLVMAGIALGPLIKVLVMMMIFNLESALMEPIVDKRITNCMTEIGNSIKMVLAVLASVSFLFIVATTLMIKMGNFTLMYR